MNRESITQPSKDVSFVLFGTHVLFQFKLHVRVSLSNSVSILEIGNLVENDSENRHIDEVRMRYQ